MSSRQEKTVQAIGLVMISFLVYILAGYNYFMEPGIRSIVKHITPLVTYLLYNLSKRYDQSGRTGQIMYSFFSISVGFLAVHYLIWFNQFLPGVVPDSPRGWAISKIGEVVPITLSILILGKLKRETPRSLYLTGGKPGRSILYGLAASSLGIIQYIVMMGPMFSFPLLMAWLPWFTVFSISNAFMEEMMFRGLFLGKYEELFDERYSLILISVIFALFHAALLPFMGLTMTIMFILFLFLQGYVWGYITQKTGSIWGAVLAHTVADILFMFAAFTQ